MTFSEHCLVCGHFGHIGPCQTGDGCTATPPVLTRLVELLEENQKKES